MKDDTLIQKAWVMLLSLKDKVAALSFTLKKTFSLLQLFIILLQALLIEYAAIRDGFDVIKRVNPEIEIK